MRSKTRGYVQREIDKLVATFVSAGVWTPVQGDAKRREFRRDQREDDAYIRTGRRRRRQ